MTSQHTRDVCPAHNLLLTVVIASFTFVGIVGGASIYLTNVRYADNRTRIEASEVDIAQINADAKQTEKEMNEMYKEIITKLTRLETLIAKLHAREHLNSTDNGGDK